MSKKQKKKVERESKEIIPQNNIGVIDENTLTLAIVKAYQIIENEKKLAAEKLEEQKSSNEKVNSEKWYIKVLFILNVLFFPWKMNKKFTINSRIYDSILVLFVSLILGLVGVVIWIIGLCAIAYGVMMLLQGSTFDAFIGMLGFGLLLIMFGSLFTLAGDEFSKVSDSNRIYAYSASIIALISCILTVLSMIK